MLLVQRIQIHRIRRQGISHHRIPDQKTIHAQKEIPYRSNQKEVFRTRGKTLPQNNLTGAKQYE